MNISRSLLSLLVLTLITTHCALAADTFVVKKIQVEGLQRIKRGTILNYLPIKVGQKFEQAQSAKLIRALYKTGFFKTVSLSQNAATLIVKVIERPTIGKIKIEGNSSIGKDRLQQALKDLGLVAGEVYDNSVLGEVKQSLKTEYYNLGKYNAHVDTTVTKEARSRVNIKLTISEGRVAKIKEIKIIGSHVFSEETLFEQLELTPSKWNSFFTRNDQYSKQKFNGDLEALRSYYMDRGYIKFKINSAQVALTPDRKSVYLVISVNEGPRYYFNGFKLTGHFPVSKAVLAAQVLIKSGDVFSRKKVVDGADVISKILGNKSYAFAEIKPVPKINEETKQVFITYQIEPGNPVYVDRISFAGNSRSAESVFRRELRQYEGAPIGTDKIKVSVRNLKMLSYVKDVDVKTTRVPGQKDKVDLDITVKEIPSAEAVFSVGYSQADGLLLSAGLTQKNFFGTGNYVSLNYDRASWYNNLNFTYANPYYTQDGISRSINVYASKTDRDKVDSSAYSTNSYGAEINYGIPIAESDTSKIGLTLGYGFNHTQLLTGNDAANEVSNFTNKYGKSFNQALLTAGWNYNGYDRSQFPTQGWAHDVDANLGIPANHDSLGYYLLDYDNNWYQPIYKDTIFHFRSGVGYGGGFGRNHRTGLPFFKNYFAGGMGSVRGFEAYSLGPRDTNGGNFGGNMLIHGTTAVILPHPVSTDKIRTSVFFDAGNVYNTKKESIRMGALRYGAGVSIEWHTPIGPLVFSLAKNLSSHKGDKTQVFDFMIGTQF